MDKYGLEGRTAIVTGGTRGIGRGISLKLASEGANIAAIWYGDLTAADETGKLVRDMGPGFLSLRGDVSDPTACREAVSAAVAEFGGVDILVNNAGIVIDKLLLRLKPEEFDKVVQTNLSGAFYMMQAAAKAMLKNGERGGRIINISSVVGLRGNPGQVNYSASKAGIIGMTLSAAKELGSRGITVNAVAPGYIETDMTAGLSEEQRRLAISATSLGRPGSPEDVAAAAAFFASPEAAYITGQILAVDGGMII